MRIVHSFSAKRCNEPLFRLHIVYFALSCIYAKRSGFEIALHCDNKTKDVLEVAPYMTSDCSANKLSDILEAAQEHRPGQDRI